MVKRIGKVTGRWLHGRELLTQVSERRRMFDGMKRMLSGHAMVER